MLVITLLIFFLLSAAAFERDEEMFDIMKAVAENLCAMNNRNSSKSDLKDDLKNLSKDFSSKFENLKDDLKNLSKDFSSKFENLSSKFENLSSRFEINSQKVETVSQKVETLSQKVETLSEDFTLERTSNKVIMKSLADRVDPIIKRHDFINRNFVIPISLAGGALSHRIYLDIFDRNSRLWHMIELILTLVQKPK